jgi:DNA-binding transcriptional MerR regulator
VVAALVEAVDPVAGLFQIVDGAVYVGHLDYREVGECSGGGAGYYVGEAGGAAVWDDHAGGAGGVRGADDGAQIVGIFNAVEHDMQTARGDGGFECRVFFGRAQRDYALMIGASGGAIELFAGFETHRNGAFAAQFDDFLKARAGGAFDDEDALQGTRGAEGFPDGMDSRDRSHYDKGTFMSAHENLPVPPALEIPDKLYFRIGEVARLAGIKPYVLRFWETEFPTLGPRKSGTGHRLYRRKDVELVLEIKRLLYEKRFTIEGARRFLDDRGKDGHGKTEATRSGGRAAARAAKAAAGVQNAQTALFSEPDAALLAAVRKELRELAEMLK